MSNTTSPSVGRPTYHFVAPRGWMNDPCAPAYDPRTRLYHLFYQWNPKAHSWGDISWGHATSTDLITWTYTSDQTVFVPDRDYDKCGIFTGCFHPTGPGGEQDVISIFYSSVNYLPISWDMPYKRGCEGISMASSRDGGKTWEKYAHNPVLTQEPERLHVTGFRDPYVAAWPAMDAARSEVNGLYGVIAGGVHDLGPRAFLYTINPARPTDWSYLHPLTEDVPVNRKGSDRWSGDLGANWECVSFMTLSERGGLTREVLIGGAEGALERPWITNYHASHPQAARRVPRALNWSFGRLVPQGREVRMTVETAGMLDWGVFYAASTFIAKDGRTLVWGWIIEEDLSDAALKAKGWTGCLGVLREVFLLCSRDVVGALASELSFIGSVDVLAQPDGANTVLTLGVRPASEVDALRGKPVMGKLSTTVGGSIALLETAPIACEIRAVLLIGERTESVTLVVRHDSALATRTAIVFDVAAETITIERQHSTTRDDINTSPEIAPFTLFRLRQDGKPSEVLEHLVLRVYLDHDVVEVFANDRLALATRVYTPIEARGVTLQAVGGAFLGELRVWEMNEVLRSY